MTAAERLALGVAVLVLSQLAARARRAAEADPRCHTSHTALALRYEWLVVDLTRLAPPVD